MAAPTSLTALLASLTQSLSLTQEAAPKLAAIEHQKDGISLLDVKNELLLSYLQNLVFLILLKLRNAKSESDEADGETTDIDDSVRTKLVELRLYLEKGARPLEEKLRFSIERFLRTAEDAQREQQIKANQSKSKGEDDDEGSESGSGSEKEEASDQSEEEHQTRSRGNKAAAPNFSKLVDDVASKPTDRDDAPTGIYRPPKRDRTLMETSRPREKAERRGHRSHTMEEFVNSELSAAPVAEPSIGTTIVQGGRKMKTSSERKEEDERRDYEEMNFVRLPVMSKKERAKKNKMEGRSGRMQFGGEEWHNLGEGVDRIDRLTKRKGPAGGNVRALLDKSRKRGLETTDGPRASGHGPEMGERFRKRAKMLDGPKNRGKRR